MTRIIVVDNGGQWTHKEWRMLRNLNVETEIVDNSTELKNIECDGIVLSGGTATFSYSDSTLGRVGDYLDSFQYPILGICVGHQFMALHFGGKVSRSKTPEFGKVVIEIEEHNDLFDGIPDRFTAWASHNDEVTVLPDFFVRTAKSETCIIEAMRSMNKQIYGIQFHPEVEHTDYGKEIFANFIKICRR